MGGEDFRKIAWVDWDSVCLSKEDGELSVRRLSEFNTALLGKWCLRMLVDKEGLWYQVLKARYGEEGDRLKEGVGRAQFGGRCYLASVGVWVWRQGVGLRTMFIGWLVEDVAFIFGWIIGWGCSS